MHEIGCSGMVHWDGPEGWNGDGDGRWEGGSGWGTHVHPWWIQSGFDYSGSKAFLGGEFFYLCKKVIGIFLGIILHL